MSSSSSSSNWREAIAKEWSSRRTAEQTAQQLANKKVFFPLSMNPFGEEEILAMTEVLLSGRLTLGAEVEKVEKRFAEVVGVPYVIMVNSGSSANLLAVSAIANKLRAQHCEVGDEVLVPAVCWSTSVHPLLQNGLKPVFVDADPNTFNVTLENLEKKMSPRVKAVMAVHVLGNAMDMNDLMKFVQRHKLMLIEDTCESLGSYFDTQHNNKEMDKKKGQLTNININTNTNTSTGNKMLGTFGDFGTYSFYFSHHITSGEGGMVVCHTEDDYNFVRCLRAHGWTRHLTNRQQVEAQYPQIDSRFLFVNVGYNLRPLEVQGAMLSVQLEKLHEYNAHRRDNLHRLQVAFHKHKKYHSTMSLMKATPGVDPAWFGIGALLHRPYAHQLKEYLAYLEAHGIENRPIISGNFIRQPCITAFCADEHPENYPGAEAIHHRGFFIGIHQIHLEQDVIEKLVDIMLAFPFVPQHVILVTGSMGMLGHHVQQVVQHSPGAQVLQPSTNESKDDKDHTDHTYGHTHTPLRILCDDSEWIFLTRADGDLCCLADVQAIFKKYQPTRVLHCAARLAALPEMTAKPVDFFLENITMNHNILQTAFEFQAWCGPIKVLCVLSTVMFPKNVVYPVTTASLYDGPPHFTCESYAYAKRSLAQLISWYRSQHGCDFVSILPANFFGPYGDFNPSTAPLVNSLIAKAESARQSASAQPLSMIGTGSPQRQIMYAKDLAKIVIWALEHFHGEVANEPLIVAGEEISIQQVADMVCQETQFHHGLKFDQDEAKDGPFRRTASTQLFQSLHPQFAFTPLQEGIKQTVAWYRQHYTQNKASTK